MAKVPVGKTIVFSYGFTLGHIGTIIGQIWLPMLLLTLGGFFVVAPYYDSFSQAVAQDNVRLVEQAGVMLLIYMVISLFFYAMIYVALTQEALGLPHSRSFIHFSLARAEWRMYGALIAFSFAFIVIVVLIVLAASFLGGVLGVLLGMAGIKTGVSGADAAQASSPVAMAVGMLVTGTIIFASTYVFVRLFFLLAPVTVAEEQISLGRGWQLTAKNFWRLLAILIATVGPIMLIMMVSEMVILGPDEFVARSAGTFAETAARMERMRPHLPVLYGLSFVLSPFLFGLVLSASAFAYRTLVPSVPVRGGVSTPPP